MTSTVCCWLNLIVKLLASADPAEKRHVLVPQELGDSSSHGKINREMGVLDYENCTTSIFVNQSIAPFADSPMVGKTP